jgi:hypothetical protein
METINVRSIIANTSFDSLQDTLPKRFNLQFDDGTVTATTKNSTLFTSLYWDLIRFYPNIVIVKEHHLDHSLIKGPFNSGSHRDILDKIYYSIVKEYNLSTPYLRDDLDRLVFEVNNNAYNVLTEKLAMYMTSIDILDFIEVTEHPSISKVVKDVISEESAKRVSDETLRVINTDPSLSHNRLAIAVRNKIVKDEQVVQCVAMRGFTTDVDSTLFKYPVTSGYVKGLKTIYESLVESRLGAKALLFSEAPLQSSEYLSRSIQLLAMSLENIHYTDCGSTKYMDIQITDDQYDDYGNLVSKSNLPNLVGKYYLDPESNTLKSIVGNEKHLLGSWVKMRTVKNCIHPDTHGVCSVCFGELSQNVQPGANLGHLCGSTLGQIFAQLILSTKHLDATKIVRHIVINKDTINYFRTDTKMDKYYLRADVIKNEYYLEVPYQAAPDLNDIIDVENVTFSDIARNTKIEAIALYNSKEYKEFTIKVDNMTGIFSNEFITYIKEKKWTINNKGNYVIDISEWNSNYPFIILAKKEFNNYELSQEMKNIIAGQASGRRKRNNPAMAAEALKSLINLISSRVNVNMAVLEVIMYGAMVIDAETFDCRLPRNSQIEGLGVLAETITNRSMSGVFAYQGLANAIISPKSYFPLYRDDYIMDVYIDPERYLKKRNLI